MAVTKKPNIILFNPDSYRADVLGHQGNPGAVTPNVDAMVATDGVSYSNAFAQNPVCTPSRCSFMTGWYPHVHGHRSMQNMLKEHEPNLLSVFKEQGYQVWWGGKNDLVRVHKKKDYLRYCDEKLEFRGHDAHMKYKSPAPLTEDDPRHGAYYQGVFTHEGEGETYYDRDTGWVLEAVDKIKNHSGDQPFLCFLPLVKPHPAYYAEEDFYNAINPELLPPRIPMPEKGAHLPQMLDDLRAEYRSEDITEEMWRDVKRIYYAMCTKVDDLFGMVVSALKENGLYDNTWIFFFSDHGDFAGDYSLPEKTHCTLQDCLLKVPLVIKPPADVPVENGNREHLTELLDITATLYDLLGIEPGYTSQGTSLRASLAGDETPIHDAVFAEVGARKDEAAFVNNTALKRHPNDFYARQGKVSKPHHKDGSLAVMCRTTEYKYIRRPYTGHHELFNLKADPHETCNLSGQPAVAKIEQQLETRLLDFFMQTADILPFTQDTRGI